MKYSNIHLIYFSPTHTSAKIVYAIAEGMGATSMSESDVTCESLDMEEYIDDELTIIAAPVYGGRVAETAMERFRMFRSAHHAPVVPVVLYGNRDYEDALKELCDLVSEQGFVPVAAGAFIGEHSFSRKGMPIAEGRPDESDLNQATEFGKKIIEELEKVSCVECLSALEVKGNFPYRVKALPLLKLLLRIMIYVRNVSIAWMCVLHMRYPWQTRVCIATRTYVSNVAPA